MTNSLEKAKVQKVLFDSHSQRMVRAITMLDEAFVDDERYLFYEVLPVLVSTLMRGFAAELAISRMEQEE